MTPAQDPRTTDKAMPLDPMPAKSKAKSAKAAKKTPDIVRPYGDTTGDGMVQVSFTLPVPHDKRAEGAALQLAAKMGLEPALLVHAKPMGPDFTFFVVYGSANHLVDLREVAVVEREFPLLSPTEVNKAIKARLRRKLVVVGRLHRHRRPHGRASTRSSTSRASRGRRAWSTTGRSRW